MVESREKMSRACSTSSTTPSHPSKGTAEAAGVAVGAAAAAAAPVSSEPRQPHHPPLDQPPPRQTIFNRGRRRRNTSTQRRRRRVWLFSVKPTRQWRASTPFKRTARVLHRLIRLCFVSLTSPPLSDRLTAHLNVYKLRVYLKLRCAASRQGFLLFSFSYGEHEFNETETLRRGRGAAYQAGKVGRVGTAGSSTHSFIP